MERAVLLVEIRALIAGQPNFALFDGHSAPHLAWLGKATALLRRWNPVDAASFQGHAGFMSVPGIQRKVHLPFMLTILHRAEADLALDMPAGAAEVFGAGAVYDFLRSLRVVIGAATSSLLIIDPYLDADIFDTYLTAASGAVSIRLLTGRHAADLKPAVEKFNAQTGATLAVRNGSGLHDRVVFVDEATCWVLGQSIKDAAKKGPTYLAPLSVDTVSTKLAAYEQIWNVASPL